MDVEPISHQRPTHTPEAHPGPHTPAYSCASLPKQPPARHPPHKPRPTAVRKDTSDPPASNPQNASRVAACSNRYHVISKMPETIRSSLNTPDEVPHHPDPCDSIHHDANPSSDRLNIKPVLCPSRFEPCLFSLSISDLTYASYAARMTPSEPLPYSSSRADQSPRRGFGCNNHACPTTANRREDRNSGTAYPHAHAGMFDTPRRLKQPDR